jgi:hypothetical protein
MATNNFGDNWLSDEERAFWGVDEHGNQVQSKQKTERQLDNEWREKQFRTAVSWWSWVVFLVGPWILILWAVGSKILEWLSRPLPY